MILENKHYTIKTSDGATLRGDADTIQIPEPITDGPVIINDHGNVEYYMPGDIKRLITTDMEEE